MKRIAHFVDRFMKSILISSFCFAIFATAYSQNEQAASDIEKQHALLKGKIEQLDLKLRNDKNHNSSRYWIERANTMHEVAVFRSAYILTDKTQLSLAYTDPLMEALSSLDSAEKLDKNRRKSGIIREQYELLKGDFENMAKYYFLQQEFLESYHAFIQIDSINQRAIMEGEVNSTQLYYTAVAASKAGLDEQTIIYYEKALAAGYEDPSLYVFLSQRYMNAGDSSKGIEVLISGFNRYPGDTRILVELVNYYLIAEESGETAIKFLKTAQENNAGEVSYIFSEAVVYNKLGNIDSAIAAYERCLELEPNYYDAYYNMGIMCYNQAQDLMRQAEDTNRSSISISLKKDAEEELKRALPYLQKACEIQPNDTFTKELLKEIENQLE